MKAKFLLILVIGLLILSPVIYFSTGIGQQGATLSPDPIISSDGMLQSSPKAIAWHQLTLPIRIEQLLIYPALLLLLHYSGLAVKLRRHLENVIFPPLRKLSGATRLNYQVRRATRNRLTLGDLAVILLYILIFSLTITLIYFPFSFYTGFVLRHQFGLSTQTWPAWTRDFAVNWGVNGIINLLLYGGFYSLMRLFPRQWPMWAGAGLTLFTFGYILLEPLVITPLFYRVTPVTNPALMARIETLANRADITIDDISVINAGSKTTTINAYFTGFGEASRIILWDTLLEKHPPNEVDVVIAHEMGHWAYRHMFIYALGGSAGGWLGLFALRWWFNKQWRSLGWRGPADVAGLPYMLAIIALVTVLTLPAANGFSRLAEIQADRFALAISRHPTAAEQLFTRFARENLSMVQVPAWEKLIFYTHPPLADRIEMARQTKLP